MFTKTAIIAALAGLSAAAPTKRLTNDFQAVTLASGTPVQYGSLSASGQRIYINKETATDCPAETVDCSKVGNSTAFVYNPATTTVNMQTIVPGGQQLYVGYGGELGYTIPHTVAIPELAKVQGFEYTPQADDGTIGALIFEGQGFDACPTGEKGILDQDVYQIFARSVAGHTGCISVSIGTAAYTGSPVWSYGF
ncbi:hypothetical protein VTL71DRAFT_4083 [Oculimacula yallundae]|uniref:Uncharacterized protein n=1 Tax=Oculimacula yallundae TaxID=86028 RepID=A0ABR4C752_9HELO